MRGLAWKRYLFAASMALMSWAASAAGLGQLTVVSALGQPLQAEIDLVSVGKDELGALSVRLATPDAYRQAGLQYDSVMADLALQILTRPNGQAYVKVASTRPVKESTVVMLIDLSWPSGRVQREYRVLLDPPR